MSFPIRRYPLDPTGRSPNNFISGEEHVLGPKAGPYHPIAVYYGPYYNDRTSFKVYKGSRLLVYGTDYWGTNLIQDATAQFGMEVCEVLIVKGMAQGDILTINYQNVGGLFQNHAKGLVDLYNAYLADNRPVDWTNGITNKPSDYPPSYHLHLLRDVVGWESLIVALERLINVLTLRNVPAFEALIDWVMVRSLDVATEAEISNLTAVDKVVTLNRLIYAGRTLNFNSVLLVPKEDRCHQGQFFTINIRSSNFPVSETLYWEIDHETSFSNMFRKLEGTVQVKEQEGVIRLTTNKNSRSRGEYTFKVNLRRNSASGPIIASSKTLTIIYTPIWDLDYGLLKNGLWQVPTTSQSHLVLPTPQSLFLIPDDHFYKINPCLI